MSRPPIRLSWRLWRVWQRNRDVHLSTWVVNLVPPLLDPFLYVLAFGLGLGAVVGEVTTAQGSMSYMRFVVPGMIGVGVMFQAYFEGTYGSFVRMHYQRTFAAQLATPLSVDDVIVGELTWAATKALLTGVLMIGALAPFGLLAWPGALWGVPLAAVAGVLFGGAGLVITALTRRIDVLNIPYFLFVSPMFLFSGTFFPIEGMPAWARAVALGLPLTHVVAALRAVCLDQPLASPWLTGVYLALATPAVAFIALILMRRRLVP